MLIGPASLLSLLKAVYQWGEVTREAGFAQPSATMNTHRNPMFNTRATHSNNQEQEGIPTRPGEEDLEDISIHFLCTYSTHPDWKQIIDTCNGYGQTLAHISATLGYSRLLQHLFGWKIDLNAVDNMGLSALHYAYLFKQEECAKFLIHSGANQFILDGLGRPPSDLDPSLEIRLRSIMEKIDSDSSADGASPNGYATEMPDEAGKLYAKHFLIQQWMRQGEDEGKDEMPPSRYPCPENLGCPITASGPPALDSPNERDWGVTYDSFPSLAVRITEKNSTFIVTEEMDREVKRMNEDLKTLESLIENSHWFNSGDREPTVGAVGCPVLAEKYGTRGRSLFTAFVTKQGDDFYGCAFEHCFAYSARTLEEVIRHIRSHHFRPCPFSCIPPNGDQWYVSHCSLPVHFPVLGED